MKSDEIAAIRAAHTIRDERLSALPPVLDRGAALRVLSEALESHRAATVLLDALAASQSREAALVAALEWIRDGLDQMYSVTNEHGMRRLPSALEPYAAMISGLHRTAVLEVGENVAALAAAAEGKTDG